MNISVSDNNWERLSKLRIENKNKYKTMNDVITSLLNNESKELEEPEEGD